MNNDPSLFAFLDVDRCLLDTEKAFSMVREISDQNTSVSAEQINAAYDQHKKAKKSFNVTGFIESHFREDEYWETHILPDFVRRGHEQGLLLPHAKEFITGLGKLGIQFGLLTYGSWSNDVADPGTDRDRSMKSQLAKIAADPTLAKIPSAVLHTPQKTSFIMDELVSRESGERAKISLPAEYREATNSFSESYDYGIVVDDKSIAHQGGNPSIVRGVLVTPETIENRNAHHVDTDEISIAGLKKVVGLSEALTATEEIATDFRRRYHAQSRVY